MVCGKHRNYNVFKSSLVPVAIYKLQAFDKKSKHLFQIDLLQALLCSQKLKAETTVPDTKRDNFLGTVVGDNYHFCEEIIIIQFIPPLFLITIQ